MKRDRSTFVAAALLLAGTLFRIWGTEHAQVSFDQTWFWSVALDIVHGERFPAFGSLISGTDARVPSPLFHFICAIPQVFGDHPKWGAGFFCLLHALSGGLLYATIARVQSVRAGLIFLALYAFAPWDVLYSHSIWLGNILPVYGTAVVVAALHARTSSRAQGVTAALIVLGPALHLSLPVVWVAAFIVLILRPPERWAIRPILLGVFLASLAFVPALVHDLQNGFENTRMILNKAAGAPPPENFPSALVQVPIYSVLFGTSEMGYWFARGYWGGGFDPVQAYFSTAGWGRSFEDRTLVPVLLAILSIATSAAAWVFVFSRVAQELAHRARAQDRAPLSPRVTLLLGIVGCLFASAILLALGKKIFFPHYITFAAQLCLFPLAWALDEAFAKPRLRFIAMPVVTLVALSMLMSTLQYYRQIEALNGLGVTIRAVDHMLESGDDPFELHFRHINNEWAYAMTARKLRGRELPLSRSAPVQYIVHNDAPQEGAVALGSVSLGVAHVRLERRSRPLLSRPERRDRMLAARLDWRDAKVELRKTDGTSSSCQIEHERCAYGAERWQYMGPEVFALKGRSEPLVFFHPVQDATLSARFAIPKGASSGALWVGLSDAAIQSNNRSPVEIVLRQGERAVLSSRVGNDTPGLHRHPFVVTATGASTLTVEITTENAGARVFGFDLELYGASPNHADQ